MADKKARRWFGTDGIRGIANNGTLNAELALRVGQAAGVRFRRSDKRSQGVIGKDTRRSSYMFEKILGGALSAAGIDAIETGPVPTPGLAMITMSLRAEFGIMITASHNSAEYNGIKIVGPDGYKISDEDEIAIEELIESGNLNSMMANHSDMGSIARVENISERYVESAKRSVPKGLEFDGLRVVIDCANGAGYKVGPKVLRELGAEVIPIGVEPDGSNINRECGSTAPLALQQKVKELRADIGIALDGDADRVLIVDELGRVVHGDQVLAIIADHWVKEGILKGACVVGTELTNSALERYLAPKNVALERAAVGDRHVLERMRALGANLGGEQSGHMLMTEHSPSGDGIVAGLQVLTALKLAGAGKKASELCHRFEPVPQMSKDLPKKAGINPLEDPAVQAAIEDGRILLGDGRLVVRNSGTEPKVRIMCECSDQVLAKRVVDSIAEAVQKAG